VQENERHSAQHRATVLRREHFRHRFERFLGWRPSAYYQRIRVYYRQWRYLLPFSLNRWKKGLSRDPYAAWIQEESRALGSAKAYAERIARFSVRPTVSILVPVQAPHRPWLEESIASVLAQAYPHWELWLCSLDTSPEIDALLECHQAREARVGVVRLPDLVNTASGLNHTLGLVRGEFICVLGQHDTLAPHALYEMVRRLQDGQADVLYSDEDAIDARGRRTQPFFKPDWSPDLCLSSLYVCHLSVYRREIALAAGGFRPEYADSAAYDLLLRCTEHGERIVHIPRVLYHRRQAQRELRRKFPLSWGLGGGGGQALEHTSAKQALLAALDRRGEQATVEDGPVLSTFRVRRQLRDTPLVSIIIPTRDRLKLLRRCIHSIETRSSYRQYEILIIDNGSREAQTITYLHSLPHRVIRDDSPFHFARLNNQAAACARGDHLLFLNNDMEVIAPDWLEALLEHSQRPEVGAVGGLLLYANQTIQHAGVVLGVRGVAGHAHKYLPVRDEGYFCLSHLIRNYSAVTAACLMMRKGVYEEVGGMAEQLAVTFNDVDLCLRLCARGYVIVYTPYARLYHHESRSRWYQPPRPEEVQYMLDHWGELIARDPYYNPHLTLEREDFGFDLARARTLLGE
jgi:GT2 family glycosyltransferase